MTVARPQSARALPAQEKKKAIFEAAQEIICARGFDRAKMEEIAARAGVGKGTLYNYFESKEDLFLSLVLDSFQQTRDLIESEVNQVHDPWERFEVAWRTLLLQVFPALCNQWSLNYQLWGFLARDPSARERLFADWREYYSERETQIALAIEEGQRMGLYRANVEARSLALLLLAIFDGLLHRAMFDPNRIDPEAALRAVQALVRNALSPAKSGGEA
jgi:AcrR family transcriptional regulator